MNDEQSSSGHYRRLFQNQRWETLAQHLVFIYLSQQFRQHLANGKVIKHYIISTDPYKPD